MKLRLVPARQGWVWMTQGLKVCKQQPAAYIGLLGMAFSAALLVLSVPIVGPVLLGFSVPVIWMAFMLATRRVLTGQRVTPGVLIEPLRSPDCPWQNWAKLGGAFFAGLLLAMQMADWLGPGQEALAAIQDKAKDIGELINHPLFQADALWRWGMSLPISLVFWHTPALLLWGRVPVRKAIFFSAVASWRNLTAFAVYGLSWLAAAIGVGLAIELVSMISPTPVLTSIVALMLLVWLASAFYASQYFTVVDCFEADTPST